MSLIVDVGEYSTKLGYGGNSVKYIFPTMIAKPKATIYDQPMMNSIGMMYDNYYCGPKASKLLKSMFNKSNPISNGLINNWDDYELLLEYSIKQLISLDDNISGSIDELIIPVKCYSNNLYKSKLLNIIFQKYGNIISNVTLIPNNIAALFAHGLRSGIVIDSGYNQCNVSIVYYGLTCKRTVILDGYNTGKNVSDVLTKMLYKEYNELQANTHTQDNYSTYLKEKYSFIKPYKQYNKDYQIQRTFNEYTNFNGTHIGNIVFDYIGDDGYKIKLPDNNQIYISNQKYNAPEILFNDNNGLPSLINKSIHKFIDFGDNNCDDKIAFKNELLKDNGICISGGNTKFDGFVQRLKSQTETIFNMDNNITIKSQGNNNDLTTFIGCSVYSQIDKSLLEDIKYTFSFDNWDDKGSHYLINNEWSAEF